MKLVDIEQVYCSDCEGKDVCEKVTCDVKKMPTIDAVPVVRCRECRWYDVGKNDSESWSECTLRYGKYFNVSPMDFCSYGQRKEADHEVSEP